MIYDVCNGFTFENILLLHEWKNKVKKKTARRAENPAPAHKFSWMRTDLQSRILYVTFQYHSRLNLNPHIISNQKKIFYLLSLGQKTSPPPPTPHTHPSPRAFFFYQNLSFPPCVRRKVMQKIKLIFTEAKVGHS